MGRGSSILFLLCYVSSSLAQNVTLFNGQQASFFPNYTASNCLAAFNTTLQCDRNVQKLYAQMDWVNWNSTNLTPLCTTACRNSLTSLQSSVTSACGSWTADVAGVAMTASTMLDMFLYKFDLTCLADGSTFCWSQFQGYNITDMVKNGKATWPNNTAKWYPDWDNDPIAGSPRYDENGTVVPPWSNPNPMEPYPAGELSAIDYISEKPKKPHSNLGWTGQPLEYDEYPLEIQCSNCFVNRFRLGFVYKWGENYDDLMAQIWSNMQQNCKITKVLTVNPVLNITGPAPANQSDVVWKNAQVNCDQSVTISTPPGQFTNCSVIAKRYGVATRAIKAMNPAIRCPNIANGTYCLPAACKVLEVTDEQTSAPMLLQQDAYKNITLVQYMGWNPYGDLLDLYQGELVCLSPPGGGFVPPTTTVAQAHPTVYTTTEKPIAPTPSGSIANCGHWHNVTYGDYCNLLSQNYSITFDQLIAMNPDLDSGCSNLLLGYDYCVASINGTTVPPLTSTKTPATKTTTVPANGVSTPTPTQSGMTSNCGKFYKVVSGDGCYDIAQKYSITLNDFYSWNPGVGSNCQSLWPDYYVCVGLIGASTATTTTKATTTTSGNGIATPTPYKPNMTKNCKKFYKVVSGDYCYLIAQNNGITVATFEGWNPDAGTDPNSCTVVLDYYYCVGV